MVATLWWCVRAVSHNPGRHPADCSCAVLLAYALVRAAIIGGRDCQFSPLGQPSGAFEGVRFCAAPSILTSGGNPSALFAAEDTGGGAVDMIEELRRSFLFADLWRKPAAANRQSRSARASQ